MNGSLPLNPIYPFSVAPSLIVIAGEEVAVTLPVTSPVTSPLKLVAVTTPANVVSPFAAIVPPIPAAVSYTHLTLPTKA